MKGLTIRGNIWWISYNVNGRRFREGISPKKSEAIAALHQRHADIMAGKFIDRRKARGITFRTIADKYWEMCGKHLRSPSWRSMLGAVVAHFGNVPAVEISPAAIQGYYNDVRARASISTANRHLTLIKFVFNKAIAWEMFCGANPSAKVSKVKEPAGRLRYLSQGELKALLSVCSPRIYPLLACALYTGMRRGELLALNWANVDLDQGLIYILQSKSGRPREIPIAPTLREILVGMGTQEPAAKVFPIPDITIRRLFERALNAAGITGFRFHDLRHTFASHFIMKTGNLPALQKILGHASPLMTQRYAHLSAGYLQTEMRAFNNCIPVESQEPPVFKGIGHDLGTISQYANS